MINIANNIRKLRFMHIMTQTELADKVGVSKQALSLAEHGHVSAKLAIKISEVLGENVFDILGEDVFRIIPKTERDKQIVYEIFSKINTD